LAPYVFEDAEGVRKALQWHCDDKFGDRAQFTALPARHRFETVKFEPNDAVDNGHFP
jgi:hypothetical protein